MAYSDSSRSDRGCDNTSRMFAIHECGYFCRRDTARHDTCRYSRVYKDASGKRPDSFNARVTHVVKRADGVAFTYAPKALPFPAIPAYTNAATLYPITERLNREILIVENLEPGIYALAFDGKTVGEFTAEEFYAGVNVALLDTLNQRLAFAAAEVADKLRGKTASLRNIVNMEPQLLAEIDDLYERMNAVRPAVSRVTVKRK